MPEPIIPSGHDYDAGLAPGRKGEKRGLLGRIAAKIKSGRKSKVHDFDLRLDPHVGARQASPRERPQASTVKDKMPSQQPEAKPDQSTRAQPTAPVPARRAKPSRSKLQAAPSFESLLEAQVPGGSLGLGAWLLIANPDDYSVSAAEYLEHVASTCEDTTLASVVRWRLGAGAGSDKTASRSLTSAAAAESDLPADIVKVLRFLAANSMSLAKYRGDLALGEGKAAALARLSSFCRRYPSAEPILRALEAGDPATARRAINLYGAAWHHGMSIINTAVAAVDGVKSTVDMPTCRIPRAWLTGSATQRCTAAALSSIVADDERSRLRRRFEPEFTAAIASMSSDLRAQAEAWLSARGVLVIAPNQPPKRRPLRTQGAGSAPGAHQPASARQPPNKAAVHNRCRRCGVGEPARQGGICSSCAHGGD